MKVIWIFLLMFLMILTYSCNNPISHFDSDNIKFLAINCINKTDDIGNILFITKVENHSDSIFSINSSDNTLSNIQPHVVLLSYRIRNGAIGVNMSIGAKEFALASNKSGIISFNLSFDALKRSIDPSR